MPYCAFTSIRLNRKIESILENILRMNQVRCQGAIAKKKIIILRRGQISRDPFSHDLNFCLWSHYHLENTVPY
jgi:hypothetical protein